MVLIIIHQSVLILYVILEYVPYVIEIKDLKLNFTYKNNTFSNEMKENPTK